MKRCLSVSAWRHALCLGWLVMGLGCGSSVVPPSDTSGDITVDASGDASVDASVDTSDDTGDDISADTSGDTVVDTSVDTVVDTSADTSADTSGDTSDDASGDTSADATDTIAPPSDVRSQPSVFQAWNGIENLPEESEFERIARHDLVFTGTHILKVNFDISPEQPYRGLAKGISYYGEEGVETSKKIRSALEQLNPHIRILAELRYRDAPATGGGSGEWWDIGYFPPDSDYWLRDANGVPIAGWGEDDDKDGVIEADEVYGYLIDFRSAAYHEIVASKALALKESGLFDGIMLDWWNEAHPTQFDFIACVGQGDCAAVLTLEEETEARLALLQAIRAKVGDDFLILVNTNLKTVPLSNPYVNGAFMEVHRESLTEGYTVSELETVESSLLFHEAHMAPPHINCLEGWRLVYDYGNQAAQVAERNSPENQRLMRLFTTLGMTHSDGYVLFGDHNAEPTPDHLHNWYPFWDASLGVGTAEKGMSWEGIEGLFVRPFTKGYAVYNRSGSPQTIAFPMAVKGVHSGESGEVHVVPDMDGELFLTE